MQGDGPQEYADYQAECDAEAQAEAQAEGEHQAQMAAEEENEANLANESIRAQEEFEREKLTNLSKAIDELEGLKIPMNIIIENIHPLKEWLDLTLQQNPVRQND